jgi:4-amino-4-deoxy-L-arabinose transferase-like glycosyltransferase
VRFRDAASPSVDRHAPIWLAAILVLALILRLIALTSLMGTVYADFLLWDERVYHLIAEEIASGAFHSKAVYQFAPFPAYLMAFIYRLFSPDPFTIRILNILLGTIACWLVYLIGKTIANRRIGLLAALIACLYKPFIFYSIVPLKESLTVCLFAWTAYLLVSLVTESDRATPAAAGRMRLCRIGLLGLAAGLLVNVRPNAVVLLPLLPLLMLRNDFPLKNMAVGLAVYLLGISCTVLPFMIRNYRVAGQFALTTTQSGSNFYLGNNLNNPDPYYRPVPFAVSSPFEQEIQFTIEASLRSGRRLSPSEASGYWSKEVIRMAAAQPIAFAGKLGLKTLVLFNRFEACDHYDIDFVGNYARFFKLPFLSFWVVLPFGIVGMGQRFTIYRKTRALAAVLGIYGLTLIAFFTNARYRLPMLTIIIPFAAAALYNMIPLFNEKRVRPMILFGAAVFAVAAVEFLPVRATDDVSAYYNTHAIILNAKGFKNEAIRYWQASSGMDRPFSAYADMALANIYYQRGDFPQGNRYLEKIPDSSFAAANKYDLMGDGWMTLKRTDLAVLAYEKSLAINSGQLAPRAKLIRIYEQTNPSKALKEKETLNYIESFYREVRDK